VEFDEVTKADISQFLIKKGGGYRPCETLATGSGVNVRCYILPGNGKDEYGEMTSNLFQHLPGRVFF
jgi:hypothetical protein